MNTKTKATTDARMRMRPIISPPGFPPLPSLATVPPRMALTAQQVREFLGSRTRADLSRLGDDAPLFSSAIIDSFVMIDLMGFLEKQTGARLAPEDLEALDSVQSILAFAEQKSKRRASPLPPRALPGS